MKIKEIKRALAVGIVLLFFSSQSVNAQKNDVPEKLYDLQRAVNAVRVARKAGVVGDPFIDKIQRGTQEYLRCVKDHKERENFYTISTMYSDILLIYAEVALVDEYSHKPHAYLHNTLDLSEIVDKYDLPTELVPGTDYRRVKAEASSKILQVASDKLDRANDLVLHYKSDGAVN